MTHPIQTTSASLNRLLDRLRHEPETVMLDEVLGAIDDAYEFTPVAFANGPLEHEAGDKVRSCAIYALGRLHGLSVPETLACFGEHYREVLADPTGDAHMTIRVFLRGGWAGVSHAAMPLKARAQPRA